jgi:hypothetical protein
VIVVITAGSVTPPNNFGFQSQEPVVKVITAGSLNSGSDDAGSDDAGSDD